MLGENQVKTSLGPDTGMTILLGVYKDNHTAGQTAEEFPLSS